MFVPRRWAQGFVNAAGDAAPAALDLVKVLAPVILSVPGQVAGTGAAIRLEPLIRRAFAAAPSSGAMDSGTLGMGSDGLGSDALAARSHGLGLILLLVKKGRLKQIRQVIEAVEQELDARRSILRGRLEAVRPVEAEFLETLRQGLMKKTGAAGVKLETASAPELLAGYRLRIGSQIIEASLRLHLRQLGAELAETYFENSAAAAHGGF
jgi:F-type H+-transporting ATPase subunit delta